MSVLFSASHGQGLRGYCAGSFPTVVQCHLFLLSTWSCFPSLVPIVQCPMDICKDSKRKAVKSDFKDYWTDKEIVQR